MIDKLLHDIKREPVTITSWIVGFVCVVFVRFIFESLSSPTTSGVIQSDAYTLVHIGLFFLATALGLMLIVGYFSKDYVSAPKIVLFGLPLIWIAPIFDIIISRGRGYVMTYIFESHQKLLLVFFKFFTPEFISGVTYGIRIEIIVILCITAYYIWLSTRQVSRSILGVLVTYTFIFILASIPGLIYTLSHINSLSGSLFEIVNYLVNIISGSNIAHNTLHEGVMSVSGIRFIELTFNKFLSQILFIISFVLVTLYFWKAQTQKFTAVIKNLRLERVLFYISLLSFGMGYAYFKGLGHINLGVDVLGILCLWIALMSAWIFAVHLNDISDLEIDKISNLGRPLVQKTMTVSEMRESAYIWLIISLIGSWSAGFYPFFMTLVSIATSYIYSMPPLRLKRITLLPSFLIGVVCLATILEGFFFVSIDKRMESFPIALAMGIIVMFALATNVRDMKDIEGDRSQGIKTLPVIFEKNGSRVVGLCFALSFFLLPLFLSFYFLYILALPAGLIGYIIITKKPFRERGIFILYFAFLLCILILYFGLSWLINVL